MFQHVALRCARRIVFQTPGAMNCYGQNIQKKSTIILNPLDCEKLPERKAECIDNRIVTVGRLYPQKNHKMLINAFSMSKAKETHSLHIYGEGSLRNELEKKIIEMNLTDKVFLEGTSKSVYEDIQNAKLFAFTSDYEGLPNALIEAMAIGIPCVSTDCSPGGAKMIINDGENGRLIECGNAEAFARALDDTLFNQEKQEKFSANGINIRHRVATGKITDEWLNFINTVVKNRKSLLQNT
jgi:glycosyltransferase involved in cell wall biosynthesis